MAYNKNRLKIINTLLERTEFISIEELRDQLEMDRTGIQRDHLEPMYKDGVIEYGFVQKQRQNKPPRSIDAVRIAHTVDALRHLVEVHPNLIYIHLTHCVQKLINHELIEQVKKVWNYQKDIIEMEHTNEDIEWILKISPTALKNAINPPARYDLSFKHLMLTSLILDIQTNPCPVPGGFLELKYELDIKLNINNAYNIDDGMAQRILLRD